MHPCHPSPVVNRRRRTLIRTAGLLMLASMTGSLRAWGQDSGAKRPIGVIGSGRIGGTIGGLWIKSGHRVMFSSRHPEELKEMASKLGPLASTGTVAQALQFADVVLIAVPYGALPQIGQDNGPALKGKIVLDACNAVAARDGRIAEEVESEGVGKTSQKYLPGTRLVRAFNTLGYTIFAREANRPDPKLAVPIAGDDAEALQVASSLVRDAGFDPVVAGSLADARRFQRGGPGYGLSVTAAELKQKLALP